MAMTVGFLDEVGRNGRAPFCSCRARLAATMMKRLMLCSASSGIEQWALFFGVFSDIGTNLTRFYFKRRQDHAASDSAEDCKSLLIGRNSGSRAPRRPAVAQESRGMAPS